MHPDIRFHLYSGNDEDVSERLDNGLVDFGLFVGNTNLEKYDYIKLPDSDVWGVLMTTDCPLAAHSTVKPADIADTPILCSRQALHSNELSGWLGRDFSKLNILSTHNLVYNAALMVKAGMGCALTIDNLINTEGTGTHIPTFGTSHESRFILRLEKISGVFKSRRNVLENS